MATMSIAPAPTETKLAVSSEDKLHLLENRLNSLQRNLSDIHIRNQLQKDNEVVDLGKKESLLARIKAAQADRSKQPSMLSSSNTSVDVSISKLNDTSQDEKKEAIVESIVLATSSQPDESKVSANNESDIVDVRNTQVTTKMIDTNQSSTIEGTVNVAMKAEEVIHEVEQDNVSIDETNTSLQVSLPPPTYNDLEIFETQHNAIYSNMVSEMSSQKDTSVDEQNIQDQIVIPLDPPTVSIIPTTNNDPTNLTDETLDKDIIEEQMRIMEQIEAEKKSKELTIKMLLGERKKQAEPTPNVSHSSTQQPNHDDQGHNFLTWEAAHSKTNEQTNTGENSSSDFPNTVDLGLGKKVKVHSQERTLESIADGTAKLVQCLNCLAKMKVTRDATLIYCPCCSSVSPVLESKLDNSQEEEDYKLALKLQQEEDSAEPETEEDGQGWFEWLGEKVGYSSPSKSDQNINGNENKTNNSHVVTGYESPNTGEARVASPSSGYFSCVVESMSNLASNSYNLASFSGEDLAFAGIPNQTNSEDTTVDYAPLLEEENL